MARMAHQGETDQARTREFVIILERPQVKSLTLPAAEYDLWCLTTDGTENIHDAIQSIQKKWEDDNPIVRKSAFDMFLRLAQIDPEANEPTELMMERATHRLRVVLDARKNGALHQSQKGYTAYMHPGLLKNPYVWVVDGTADLTLRDSKYGEIVKESDYDYHLVCPGPPIIPEIEMIERNLKKTLASVNGDMGQAHQTVQGWIGSVLGFLESLVEHHTKILVVVWKDFTDSANSQAFGISPLVKGVSLGFSTGQILTHFKMDICERLAHRIHHLSAIKNRIRRCIG
jgi:hypothetical protein